LVELSSRRRERHAKTIDIAQEEVLTCLGIHLYERLHRIWQKLRAEEQTWQMLFYLGVDALRKSFEVKLHSLLNLYSIATLPAPVFTDRMFVLCTKAGLGGAAGQRVSHPVTCCVLRGVCTSKMRLPGKSVGFFTGSSRQKAAGVLEQ